MDSVTSCWRTYVEHRVTYTFGDTALDFVMVDQTDTHRVNKWIAIIAVVEHHFAADRWNADTVTVSRNTGYHVLE
ncbi:hypothetical protein D3C80_1798110 [compost metagenome]